MTKTALLAATAALSLTAGGWAPTPTPTPLLHGAGAYHRFHMPKTSKVLYNQNSDYASNAMASTNFTSGVYTAYDSQSADDFVVPRGATWSVSGVDVSGTPQCDTCTPTSENVIFYKNSRYNTPGKPVKKGTYDDVVGTYSDGNIAINLPKPLRLKAGHYWVSVIANIDLGSEGNWWWNYNGTLHGDQAMWRNPANGYLLGCENWGTIGACTGSPAPDLMFDLRGTSKK